MSNLIFHNVYSNMYMSYEAKSSFSEIEVMYVVLVCIIINNIFIVCLKLYTVEIAAVLLVAGCFVV